MGIIAKLKGELVDIIEWIDDSRSTLAWRYPRYQNEIKNGAELIVREGQQAVFVYRGQIADKFDPGHYQLVTENLPILSTLQGWPHGFRSPFRSEVYFINTRAVTDLRWGTPSPVTVRDPDFTMVQVRANGLCVLRIADPEIFLREVIGTDSSVTTEEIAELLRRVITLAFSDMIMATKLGAIDLQGHQVELSDKLRDFVQERVDDEFGLKVESVTMNITLPEEITQAMTRGVARGVEQARYLDNVGPMDRLQQGAAAEAMVEAARNPGGEAGSMMGAGLGMALGQQMGNMMAGQHGSARIPATTARATPTSSGAAVPRRAQRSSGRAVHRRSAAPVRGQRAADPGLLRVDRRDAELGCRADGSRAGLAVRAAASAAAPAAARGAGVTQGPPGPPPQGPPPPRPQYPPYHHSSTRRRRASADPTTAPSGRRCSPRNRPERIRVISAADRWCSTSGIQQLKCPNCGNVVPIVEDAGRQVVEHDLRSAWGQQQASSVARFAGPSGQAAQKEIVCQNCGGHTTFTGTLTALRCPYCATPIQRDDVRDAPDRLPVDAVLPFRMDEANARAEVDKWINGRWFAPSEFKKYNDTGALSSIYVAYFTYDATAVTDYTGERGRRYEVTVGEGNQKHTETRTEWTYVNGQVTNSFDDLPVLANTGLDEQKIAALEPWPTQQVKPFSAEYIAGHLSRTYDRTVEQAFEIAKTSMESTIDHTVRRDIGGDEQRVHNKNTNWYNMTFKHVLLPIWLLTVIYNGKPFQVCINGFTGEVQGRRPYSTVKIVALISVVVLVILAVMMAYSTTKGG